jgi:hypothetical protein
MSDGEEGYLRVECLGRRRFAAGLRHRVPNSPEASAKCILPPLRPSIFTQPQRLAADPIFGVDGHALHSDVCEALGLTDLGGPGSSK